MIEVYVLNSDGELEYRGRCTIDGTVEDIPENAGDPPAIEMVASDLEDLTVNEVLGLHNGPHIVAADMRDIDDIPDDELARMREAEARENIERMAQTNTITKRDGFRLLESHAEPYPIRDVIFAAVDVYGSDWVDRVRHAKSDAEVRRKIAQSDRVDDVIEQLEQSE
jgi:23S rRNA A2030 N6-methylase RlmJ